MIMTNLNKMKKCELIEYCQELLKGADNKLLEENEKLKEELKEQIKIGDKLDLQVYRQDKVLGDYLAINSKLEEDIHELKNENEKENDKNLKIIFCYRLGIGGLKKENEELTNCIGNMDLKMKELEEELKNIK
jgi:hypothetical protein